MPRTRPDAAIHILLIDDSPGDVRLTQEAFRLAAPGVHLHVANDGLEAMAFLRRTGDHADAPRSAIILLDLDMPGMDGREVLTHIKDDADLKTIPTIILTTSMAQADIKNSYRLQANCYLNKSSEIDTFGNLVNSINDFWLTKAQLPLAPAQ
jgi:two-component system, chemotaxis family, response regulator Rcp1